MLQLLLSLIEQSRDSGLTYREFVTQAKKQYIIATVKAHHFNQSRAARELGMHRNSLSRTLAELNIDLAALEQQSQPKPVRRVLAHTEPIPQAI